MNVCQNISTAFDLNSNFCLKNMMRRHLSPSRRCSKFDEKRRCKKSSKKRSPNKNEKMKNIINNIEKEIEEQLEEDNDFTTSDVKGILKELIMDEDMKEMVRQTLHLDDTAKCYEPKLTRAKVRKLLELRPDLKWPMLWSRPQNNINFVSECLSLINEDYSENSSEDEEYRPDDDDDDDDEGTLADSSFQSESEKYDPEQMPDGNFHTKNNATCTDPSRIDAKIEENIGQRTRSKLPLTEKRIEEIEQTFHPPDITTDMYDCNIDNEDYLNFLREYNTSYDSRNLDIADVDDDVVDDPEYRPADAETVDKEELRSDESTEVTSTEMWQLIQELIGVNEPVKTVADRKKLLESSSLSANAESNSMSGNTVWNSVDANTGSNFVAANTESNSANVAINIAMNKLPDGSSPDVQLQNHPHTSKTSISMDVYGSESRPITGSPMKNSDGNGPVLSKQQKLLFEQQLRQHVQLATMHFLQCYKHPTLHQFAKEMKDLLVSLYRLSSSNNKSAYYANNLNDSLNLINEWEKRTVNVPDEGMNFLSCRNTDASKSPSALISQNNTWKKKRVKKRRYFPPELMKLVCKSNAFLYPLLLPDKPFTGVIENRIRRGEITKSEEWLLAVGLQQFYEYTKHSKQLKPSQSVMRETLKLIIHYLLPHYTPAYLHGLLTRRSADDPNNSSVKYYLEHKKAPPLKHFVIPVTPIPLYKQPFDLLPKVWQDYISENFVLIKRK